MSSLLSEKELKTLNRKNAICMALLLNFDDPIVYDYVMIDSYLIGKHIIEIIESIDMSKSLKKEIFKISFSSSKDDCSDLEYFMAGGGDNRRIRSEWFGGHGTLFAWREKEKSKALKFVKKHLTTEEIKDIEKLKPFMHLNKKPYTGSSYFVD